MISLTIRRKKISATHKVHAPAKAEQRDFALAA
jgi:hypothetical protein